MNKSEPVKIKFALVGISTVAVVLACLLALKVFAGQKVQLDLLPLPLKVEQQKGVFRLQESTRIFADTTAEPTVQYLVERLRNSTGFPLPVGPLAEKDKPKHSILLTTHEAKPSLAPEGYELEVHKGIVIIRAPEPAGLFYGAQSLLQLFPEEIFSRHPIPEKQWTVPCVRIEDRPRFPWRGVLLDVARHFFTKHELEEFIDAVAIQKVNVLQLHLTDDQGWRLEIKKYPRLTEVGAWRKSIGFNLDPQSSHAYGPDGRYGGFYSQSEMREIIAYAQSRHITIVPEIEMPGHASAALAAYPQLSCSGGPYSTDMSESALPGVYCASKDETYAFLEGVLTEVCELFPGKYVHIGGDEVNKDNWHGCPSCQELMRREGLKTEHELESYFVRRIEKILNAKGKTLIGWSEIREGGLAQNAVVMDWIGGAVEAATAGHDVIMSPTSHCYLDYYQSRDRTNEPPAIGAFLPLQTVYSFEPIPEKLDPQYYSHILGAQGNIWTEFIPSLRQVEYMAFPRLCALAEVTWSPRTPRDWDDFVRRLANHLRRLDELGINYRKGFFEK